MKKLSIFILLCFLLAGLFISSVVVDKVVFFEDVNLEIAIRETIENTGQPVYQSQLLGIESLDLSGKEIANLSGLEQLRNLTVLNLADNHIHDVSSLQSLNNLKILNLQNNGIVDLKAIGFEHIEHLPLTELALDNNVRPTIAGGEIRLSDILLLESFTKLEMLSARNNHIDNISPLSSMSLLKSLDLRNNRIRDISHLSNLNKLETLDLSRNNIMDIQGLKDSTNLSYLNLRNNQLKDISALSNLTNLTYLNLHSNHKILSVTSLAQLINLDSLIIENVPVNEAVWVFSDMINLSRLNITNCGMVDFTVLGELMAVGALQNNPEKEITATVSIRDNLLLEGQEDPLKPIRPYWENIENRDPLILPRIAGLVESPKFSQRGGYFTRDFTLSLWTDDPALEIYYTLDGSDPDPNQINTAGSPYEQTFRYSNPLQIKSRAGDANVFSLINTTHVEHLMTWAPPKNEVYKATIVRAITFDRKSETISPITTQTYFVDEDIFRRYSSLPVISISADYDVLFGEENGILNTGKGDDPFFHHNIRVPANIELFEPDGTLGFEGLYEIKLHGNTSVANPQKGFHVFAEPWLGQDQIQYPFFKDSNSKASQLTSFDRVIFRAWGTALDWDVFFSDAYHQTLMAEADLDIQDYRPAIVFINGEYWGLYEIRETNKNAEYYHAHYYQGEEVPLDILKLGTADLVEEGDLEHWYALLDFIAQNDMRVEENYAYIKTQMDVDNFIEYVIHCIYTGKMDWPYHNEAMWRPKTSDGRWRWIQFDMDQGLRPGIDNLHDMINHVIKEDIQPHLLFIQLLENKTFKHAFLNRFADLLNTHFLTTVEMDYFLEMAEELEPYIPEFQDRWQLSSDWEESKALALKLIENRWVFRKNQVLENFNLSGTEKIHLMADPSKGSVKINSILIKEETPGISDPLEWSGYYFRDIPVTISAIPKPGYHFVGWQTTLTVDRSQQQVTFFLTEETNIKAIFEPDKK